MCFHITEIFARLQSPQNFLASLSKRLIRGALGSGNCKMCCQVYKSWIWDLGTRIRILSFVHSTILMESKTTKKRTIPSFAIGTYRLLTKLSVNLTPYDIYAYNHGYACSLTLGPAGPGGPAAPGAPYSGKRITSSAVCISYPHVSIKLLTIYIKYSKWFESRSMDH